MNDDDQAEAAAELENEAIAAMQALRDEHGYEVADLENLARVAAGEA